MPTYKISLDQLPTMLAKEREKLSIGMIKAMREIVHTRAPMMAQEAIDQAKPRPPVDRGTYRRQFMTQDVPGGAVVYNPTKYAGVLELGRRPGGKQPPTSVLIDWVIRKGLVGNKPGRTKVSKSQRAEARGIAFVIARKMKEKGWPFPPNQPMQIMRRIYDRLMPEVFAKITEILTEHRS